MRIQKNIIISGDRASGKTWIKNAIVDLFPDKKVFLVVGYDMPFKLDAEITRQLYCTDLLIIEGLPSTSIKRIEHYLKNTIHLLREGIFNGSIIYTTQDKVSPSAFPSHSVINCNNNYIN